MMGRRKRDQGKLFYEFRLEDRILENDLLRRMNVFVAGRSPISIKSWNPITATSARAAFGDRQRERRSVNGNEQARRASNCHCER